MSSFSLLLTAHILHIVFSQQEDTQTYDDSNAMNSWVASFNDLGRSHRAPSEGLGYLTCMHVHQLHTIKAPDFGLTKAWKQRRSAVTVEELCARGRGGVTCNAAFPPVLPFLSMSGSIARKRQRSLEYLGESTLIHSRLARDVSSSGPGCWTCPYLANQSYQFETRMQNNSPQLW